MAQAAANLYPSLAGPTLLLNLPFLLQAPHRPRPSPTPPLDLALALVLTDPYPLTLTLAPSPSPFPDRQCMQALVSLFKPLFPASVQARLKFEKASALPADLADLAAPGGDARRAFLAELSSILAA